MKNPFEKHPILLNLSIKELELIVKSIQTTNPDRVDELILYGLYAQFQRKLEELNGQ